MGGKSKERWQREMAKRGGKEGCQRGVVKARRGGKGKEGLQRQRGVAKTKRGGKDKPLEGRQRQRRSSRALELWLHAYTPGQGPLPLSP